MFLTWNFWSISWPNEVMEYQWESDLHWVVVDIQVCCPTQLHHVVKHSILSQSCHPSQDLFHLRCTTASNYFNPHLLFVSAIYLELFKGNISVFHVGKMCGTKGNDPVFETHYSFFWEQDFGRTMGCFITKHRRKRLSYRVVCWSLNHGMSCSSNSTQNNTRFSLQWTDGSTTKLMTREKKKSTCPFLLL